MEDNIKVTAHCFGCGAELQNEEPSKTGYIPAQKLLNNEPLLCQRCFRLQHYGIVPHGVSMTSDYISIIKKAVNKKCLIIYVVDLFAFECSLIHEVNELIKDSKVLIVANKRDVLPKSIDDQKLIDFVSKRLAAEGVNPVKIIISSAMKNYNLDDIIKVAMDERDDKDVYVIGAASVGKSSIINCLLKSYSNKTKHFISTSPFPGTTLDVIEVPIDNKSFFYDTPGLLLEDSIFAHIENNVMRYVVPRSEIKTRTFQINDHQSLIIGGLARLDFLKGTKTGFTFYISNDVDIHRTRLDRSDAIMESMMNTRKIRPTSALLKGLEDFTTHEFDLPKERYIDITISGYCWIKIKGMGQKIRIVAPRGVLTAIRDCKI